MLSTISLLLQYPSTFSLEPGLIFLGFSAKWGIKNVLYKIQKTKNVITNATSDSFYLIASHLDSYTVHVSSATPIIV